MVFVMVFPGWWFVMAVIVCRLAISVILVVTIMVSLGCYCLD